MIISNPNGSHLIDPAGHFLRTLQNCMGYYQCPVNAEGKPLGPLVGYTAEYEKGKVWVGFAYYNFSKADIWPAVLTFFAEAMARRLRAHMIVPDIIVGAPWAGVKFSQEVARVIGCRHIFAEKTSDGGLTLGRYDSEILPNDRVLIGEELVNNTSTTGKLIDIVERGSDVSVVGIMCAINRSSPFKSYFDLGARAIPIVGVIERSTPQYRQDDPLVAESIRADNVVWKPKYEWSRMKAAVPA